MLQYYYTHAEIQVLKVIHNVAKLEIILHAYLNQLITDTNICPGKRDREMENTECQ